MRVLRNLKIEECKTRLKQRLIRNTMKKLNPNNCIYQRLVSIEKKQKWVNKYKRNERKRKVNINRLYAKTIFIVYENDTVATWN